jgi:Patatin-like phospholipase
VEPLEAVKGFTRRIARECSDVQSDADVKLSMREKLRGSPTGSIGIALSGGGIRSATFNLGALQVLRERGLLEKADHISAVSGGAYIASALAVTTSSFGEGGTTPPWARGSPEEEHLRNNASYIAPTPWKKVEAVGAWARGFLVNIAVLIFVVVVVGAPLGWTFGYMHPALQEGATVDWIQDHRYLRVAGIVWLLGFSLFLVDAILDLSLWGWHLLRKVARGLMTVGIWLALFFAIPYLLLLLGRVEADPAGFIGVLRHGGVSGTPVPYAGNWVGLLQIVMVVNVVLAGARALLAAKRSIYVMVIAALAGPLLVTLPFLAVIDKSAWEGLSFGSPGESALVLVFVSAALVLLELFFNTNKTTLHYFYAHRLATVFAVQRSGRSAEPISGDDPIRLSEHQPSSLPSFTYCAAANALSDGTTPPGRNAVPFVFSSTDCGGLVVGSMSARDLEECAPWLSVPSAVAISGAAFSPTMGKYTRRSLTFLMTLLNARLGMWMPNPHFNAKVTPTEPGRIRNTWRAKLTRGSVLLSSRYPKPGIRYLMYEFLAWHRLDRRYLYVTDGGHYDNLGLVELLRRRCTTIYCFDASGDAMETFNTLGETIAIARSDHGVEFDVDPRGLKPADGDGHPPQGFVTGTFSYPPGPDGERVTGTLVFVKAVVTSDAPWDVKAFREKDKNFPNHSTANQLFTDQKFESYRELGEFQTRRALEAMEGAVPAGRVEEQGGKIEVRLAPNGDEPSVRTTVP